LQSVNPTVKCVGEGEREREREIEEGGRDREKDSKAGMSDVSTGG
jgi:hypothetical protein